MLFGVFLLLVAGGTCGIVVGAFLGRPLREKLTIEILLPRAPHEIRCEVSEEMERVPPPSDSDRQRLPIMKWSSIVPAGGGVCMIPKSLFMLAADCLESWDATVAPKFTYRGRELSTTTDSNLLLWELGGTTTRTDKGKVVGRKIRVRLNNFVRKIPEEEFQFENSREGRARLEFLSRWPERKRMVESWRRNVGIARHFSNALDKRWDAFRAAERIGEALTRGAAGLTGGVCFSSVGTIRFRGLNQVREEIARDLLGGSALLGDDSARIFPQQGGTGPQHIHRSQSSPDRDLLGGSALLGEDSGEFRPVGERLGTMDTRWIWGRVLAFL